LRGIGDKAGEWKEKHMGGSRRNGCDRKGRTGRKVELMKGWSRLRWRRQEKYPNSNLQAKLYLSIYILTSHT